MLTIYHLKLYFFSLFIFFSKIEFRHFLTICLGDNVVITFGYSEWRTSCRAEVNQRKQKYFEKMPIISYNLDYLAQPFTLLNLTRNDLT